MKQGWSLLMYRSTLCLEGLKKTMNTFNQDSWFSGNNLKSPECKAELLTILLQLLSGLPL
jgi:hypothetical protein